MAQGKVSYRVTITIPSLQLKDLTNHVVEFSQDQHGSR